MLNHEVKYPRAEHVVSWKRVSLPKSEVTQEVGQQALEDRPQDLR
jgi:hypothetical protein